MLIFDPFSITAEIQTPFLTMVKREHNFDLVSG